MLGSKISNAPEKNSFAISFMHLRLRTECKEDYLGVGESKARQGLHYRVVKIMCSLEGGDGLFQRHVT